MGTFFRFLAGVIVGGVVGGAAGLLLAPRSGAQTQQDLRERAKLVVEEGRRAAAERRTELESQFAQAKLSAR